MTRLEQIEKELKKLTNKVNCGVQFFDTFSNFPEEGRQCALYVDKSTGDIYVWNGTEYIINNASGGGGEYYRCGLTVDELDLTFISNQISTLGSYTIPTLYIGDELSYQTGDEIRIILFNGEYLTGIIGSYDSVTGQATSILVTGVFGTGEDFLDCVNLESAYQSGFVPYIGADQNVDLGNNNLDAYALGAEYITANYLTTDTITANALPAATTDTDAFIVKEFGQLATRTGAEVLSDIGGQAALTLTTSGTSGAATLTGATLNIPQYQGAPANTVTGTGVAGQISYFSGTSTIAGTNSFFWDNVNNRLSVNAGTTPTATAHIKGTGSTNTTNTVLLQNSSNVNILTIRDDGRIQQTIPSSTDTTIFGTNAGNSASLTGGSNSFFGANSGLSNTTGNSNSFFGQNSARNNTTGVSNSFFGVNSGPNNTTGGSNSFFGVSSGLNNSTGGDNSFFGRDSGRNINTGNSNSFFGRDSGRYIANGSNLTNSNNSVFIGFDTRASADSETNQTVIGYQAIGNGSNTVTIGNSSVTTSYLRGVISTGTGTTSATNALVVRNSTPTDLLVVRDDGRIQQTIPGLSGATIFGKNAGDSSSLNGSNNSFFGEFSGRDTTTGASNSFFGRSSGLFNTVGNQNSLFGTNAGSGVSTGDNNSFFGYFAGRYLSDGSTLLTSISNSVFIGSDTRANGQSQINQIVIGYQAIGLGSNTTVLGNSSTTQTHLYGSLTVGDTTLHASAVVDISSTTKGFLPPRGTTAQRNAIVSPAEGLIFYDIDLHKLYVYDGTSWQQCW